MNALYTKLALLAAVLAVLVGGYIYIQNLQGRLEKAKTDAWAYREVAKEQWLYIDRLGKEQDIAMAKDAKNQEGAKNVKNDGCEILPLSFRDFVTGLQ